MDIRLLLKCCIPSKLLREIRLREIRSKVLHQNSGGGGATSIDFNIYKCGT